MEQSDIPSNDVLSSTKMQPSPCVTPAPHHEQEQLCFNRPQYRQGRKMTAIKVYSVVQESVYLVINGVPSIKLQKELCVLCQRYGQVLVLKQLSDYPSSSAFSEVFLVKYSSIKEARFAKKLLDGKNFFGGLFHVCYAPELETVDETRMKLLERRSAVKKAIANKTDSCTNTGYDSGKTTSGSVIGEYHPDDKLSQSMKRIGDRLGYKNTSIINEKNVNDIPNVSDSNKEQNDCFDNTNSVGSHNPSSLNYSNPIPMEFYKSNPPPNVPSVVNISHDNSTTVYDAHASLDQNLSNLNYSSMSSNYETGIGEVSNEGYSGYSKTTYAVNNCNTKSSKLKIKSRKSAGGKQKKSRYKNNKSGDCNGCSEDRVEGSINSDGFIGPLFPELQSNSSKVKDNYYPTKTSLNATTKIVKSHNTFPSDPSNPRQLKPAPNFTKVLPCKRKDDAFGVHQENKLKLLKLQNILNDTMPLPPGRGNIRFFTRDK